MRHLLKFQKGFLDIFILALLWGPSYLFGKIALQDMTPLTIVATRISIGTLLLYGVVYFKRIHLSHYVRLLPHCFILGIFSQSLPFLCFSYSLMTIPSSISALINASTPVLTILLANLFLKDERLTWNRVIGIIMGLSGFLVLWLPTTNSCVNSAVDPKGMLLSFVGACSYAIGMIYARIYVKNTPALVAPMLQLLSSLIYLIPLAFLIESPIELLPQASMRSWGCILGLGLLGTTLAYIMYYRIIATQGATAVSMVTYLLPMVATVLGVVFLNEHIGLHFCIAAILILCGIGVIKKGDARR